MSQRVPRLVAGVGVLVILAIVAVSLIRPYQQNWEFQREIEKIADKASSATAAELKNTVFEKATAMQLPITQDQIQVIRTANHLKIDVRYQVRADLSLYTVNLHFHPGTEIEYTK